MRTMADGTEYQMVIRSSRTNRTNSFGAYAAPSGTIETVAPTANAA